MLVVLSITAIFLLLCLAYPAWLLLQPSRKLPAGTAPDLEEGVSLVIPCYNEAGRIGGKIRSLLQELACFEAYEVLVIDNCSTDGTREILSEFMDHPCIHVVLKDSQLGIPHSMNMGVRLAQYDRVVFSDVRQRLTCNILRKLVAPLGDPDVGAVSACLAARTGERSYSILRRYENYLKKLESRSGNLIGVYGPLYAIRKECYRPIPEHIILDDLYNGLSILSQKSILMLGECQVIDEDFMQLYDYRRSKRYLHGFLQILRDHSLIGRLTARQQIMLLWHKYLRLILPLLFLAVYLSAGVLGISDPYCLALFGFLTVVGLLAVWPALNRFDLKVREMLRVIIFYIGATIDLIIHLSTARRTH